jgi:hypothetical protein
MLYLVETGVTVHRLLLKNPVLKDMGFFVIIHGLETNHNHQIPYPSSLIFKFGYK